MVSIDKIFYIQICSKMQKVDQNGIQRELQRLNIPYDMMTIREVHMFLDKYIGLLSAQDALYHIPAACAITCQTIKIPTVGSTELTSTGIKIENVMRHIGNLSKQKFLETIEMQIKKSDFLKHSLVEKVSNIKIAFRVFKKYKTIFETLSYKNKIPFKVNHDLLAFFWIVFLLAKINLQALQDLNYSTKILAFMIEQIFCNYYGRDSRERVRDIICQKDNFAELSKSSQQEEASIKAEVYNIMNKAIKNRDPESTPNCNGLIENDVLLSRIVDDLNSEYDRLYQALPQGRFIDQMTFLELTKELTPQAFLFKAKQQPISKVISFVDGDDDDDQDDEDEMKDSFKTEGKRPNFAEVGDSSQKSINVSLFSSPVFKQVRELDQLSKPSKSLADLTPVSLSQSKSTWAQNFIEKFDLQKEQVVKNYFESRGVNFENFVHQIKQRIQQQVENLTPYILNKGKVIMEILKMSFSSVVQLMSSRGDQIQIWKPRFFHGLLCISAFLYNSATRCLSLQLQKYCLAYHATLIDCLTVIYELSEHVGLPLLIKQVVSQLEKQVLIKQLWDTNLGYQLILENKSKKNEAIYNRLQRRIFQRIKEICVAIKVDLSEVHKVEALVKQILSKKPEILMKNKLDQIIICSISACLNLNEAKYNLALSTIFQRYNSLSLSMNSNREVLSSPNEEESAPQTLLQFYNRIFIHQVQEMMSKEECPKYLYTPIRQNHLRKLKDESASSFPSAASTLANRELRSSLTGQGPINKYQQHILEKMKQTEKEQSGDSNQDSQHSPCFGTGSVRLDFSFELKRKFTFGNNNTPGSNGNPS